MITIRCYRGGLGRATTERCQFLISTKKVVVIFVPRTILFLFSTDKKLTPFLRCDCWVIDSRGNRLGHIPAGTPDRSHLGHSLVGGSLAGAFAVAGSFGGTLVAGSLVGDIRLVDRALRTGCLFGKALDSSLVLPWPENLVRPDTERGLTGGLVGLRPATGRRRSLFVLGRFGDR